MKKIKVFISYSHIDEDFKIQLVNHLSPLKKQNIIEEWHDRKLTAGEELDKKIDKELIKADIILFLISSDFIASNYCFDVEVKKAMERHERGLATIIPIILRPCDWKNLPFSKILCLPKDGKPISKWENMDEGFLDIIEGIKSAINKISNKDLQDNSISSQIKTISFEKEVIIGKLPRGYVVIEDISFNEHSSWSVVASYYDYDNNWLHSTHYHDSYNIYWVTPNGIDKQCRKLRIPAGDWFIAESTIYLIMELRSRKKGVKIEDILKTYNGKYDYFEYYHKRETITKPLLPNNFHHLNKTGEIRDIIAILDIKFYKKYDLIDLHREYESIRRRAFLLLYDKIDSNHPALKFVNEIIEDYKSTFNIDELMKWGNRLSDALNESCKYIK